MHIIRFMAQWHSSLRMRALNKCSKRVDYLVFVRLAIPHQFKTQPSLFHINRK